MRKVLVPRESENEPNKEAPLNEPERHRRIWAAYLHRGYTRTDFARLLGVHYNALHKWDQGIHAMPLDTFASCCKLLNFSADELLWGAPATKSNGHARGHSQSSVATVVTHANNERLSESEILSVLRSIEASPQACESLAKLYLDPAHFYQPRSRVFVTHFARAFDKAHRLTDDARTAAALSAATNAQAAEDLLADRGLPPSATLTSLKGLRTRRRLR